MERKREGDGKEEIVYHNTNTILKEPSVECAELSHVFTMVSIT